jgi:hypothetical protein
MRNIGWIAVVCALACLGGLGCYSFTATTLPSHIKTIQIHEVQNNTNNILVGNALRDGITDMFRRNAGKVRLVNEDANADFEITLTGYSNNPESNTSAGVVETYRVTLVAKVRFFDNVTQKVIYENSRLQATGSYDMQTESEETGQERAIETLESLIVSQALAKW